MENFGSISIIASHLCSPLRKIPANKIADLLAIKKRLGLSDARFPKELNIVTDDLVTKVAAASTGRVPRILNEEEAEQLIASFSGPNREVF